MSKRRISKQQSVRIEKQQQYYRQLTELERDDITFDGLVITRHSQHAYIEDARGTSIRCAIRPTIDSLVAGDRVIWQAEGENQGVIISRYPRQSFLGRPDQRGQIKVVAANITHILIVIAPRPEVSWMLLDSYLVMAEHLNIHASIIVNKTDLACQDLRHTLLHIYEPLGYPLIFTNREEDNKTLLNAFTQQVAVLVGQSGVGKSSLIARLLPHLDINTGAISEQSQLGRHTTSNSQLYHLPNRGALIDSPGVREFGLWHMPIAQIAQGFREFRPYLNQCKFRNCTHHNGPGCAIQNAVKNKLVAYQRYENYVKISSLFGKTL